MEHRARIIMLNGTSSAGKTTLARALLETLPEPFMHLGPDLFQQSMARRYYALDPPPGDPAWEGVVLLTVGHGARARHEIHVGPVAQRAFAGVYAAIAAVAAAGSDLTVDTALHTPTECARQIADHLSGGPPPVGFDRLRARLAPAADDG